MKDGSLYNKDEYDENGNKNKPIQKIDYAIKEVIYYKKNKYYNLTGTIKVAYERRQRTETTKETVDHDSLNSILR